MNSIRLHFYWVSTVVAVYVFRVAYGELGSMDLTSSCVFRAVMQCIDDVGFVPLVL
jgi:hypothetical protein